MTIKNKILIIEKSDYLIKLIHDNINGSIIDIAHANQALERLLNDPKDYDLIIITNKSNKKEKIELIQKIQSCNDLKFLTITVEIDDLGSKEREEYIKAGARYCFPTNDNNFALSIIKKSLIDSHRLKLEPKEIDSAKNLQSALFKFKNLNEAKSIAGFIAEACPNPKLALMGISELCINAIEHGNLKISYDEKTKINNKNNWNQYIEKKLLEPENSNKYVTIEYKKVDNKEIKITIKDSGDGFEWKKYQKLDNARLLDNHGRGVFLATNLAFHKVEYSGKGNIVTAIIKL